MCEKLIALYLIVFIVPLLKASGLADGTDTGSIVGNVWSPGRLNGVVNKASWDLVPTNRWIEVNNTRLDSLDAEVKAAIPGWFDPSSQKWGGITHAWNGVAIDELGHRAWWVSSGGHGDGANNGIYRFDAFNMKYSIEHMPSDSTKWSTDYAYLRNTITYSSCSESNDVYEAKKANGTINKENDWYKDELYWDNQPTARHTYSGALYVPERNEIILAVGRLWRYSLSEGKWFYKIRGEGPDEYSTNGAMGEEIIAHYDQSRDQVLVCSCGSPGPWSNMFNLTNLKWTGETHICGNWDLNGAADYRHNNTVTLFRVLEPAAQYSSKGFYWSYDIVTRQVLAAHGNVSLGPGVNGSYFMDQNDHNGMVYVPPLNRYWVVAVTKQNQLAWMELDPTTKPFWTYSFLNFDGPTPTLSDGKTIVRRRMMWLPNMNAVLWLGSADKNVQIFKVGDYVPVQTTSASVISTVTTGSTAKGTTTGKASTTATTATTGVKASTATTGGKASTATTGAKASTATTGAKASTATSYNAVTTEVASTATTADTVPILTTTGEDQEAGAVAIGPTLMFAFIAVAVNVF